ncbi:SDR family oxidoreductase [Streptomyces sp. NPDC017988]|uniref:SDR family oxidoreductase n=1 Tax=Streptomyces sp. NPDC017988 TaxID=3365025 RepID=UPI0037A9E551
MRHLVPLSGPLLRLAVVNFLASIGFGMYASGNAIYFTRYVGLPVSQVGVGLTVAGLIWLPLSIHLGRFADKVGARRATVVMGAAQVLLLVAATAVHGLAEFVVVVSLLGVFAQGGWICRCPSLREVVTAGEQLSVTPAIRRFFTDLTHASLENQYGPTETHVVTAERLAGPPASWPERPAIGRPVPGARVHVLDGAMRPCPVGATGELHVGGRAPAQGYLGLPELTAERFLRDPHAPAPSRVYRTGDLARLLPDGRIELLGRTDDQVKIRGHRVETGEVESAVKAVPGVADAAVVATDGAPREGKRLAAGHLPTAEDGITPEALRSALLDRLPSFRVPAICAPLTSFPLTPSGKVDRAALALHRAGTEAAPSPGEPARTPTEKRVTELCATVLGVGAVGVEDDFFARGGDSLRAVRLALALRKEFGVAFPMNCVFTAPTPAALARLVERLGQRPDAPDPMADLVLPADIVPAPQVLTVATDPKEVLLTGATGFLGAFLLRELLVRTSARVHRLVRGTDQAHAAARLRAVQEAYGIVNEEEQGRIVVHAGDPGLPRLGLSEEAFDRLARTVFEALRDFVAHHGGAVVKPTMGSGSLAVRKVRSPDEAAETWDWVASFGVRHFMVEELLAGPELSVESFSVAGRHTVLAITGKDNGDGVVALGHVVPAELSQGETAAVAALTCRMLDAVGLVEGPAHTEVILTADGPRVVESHNRCAGGHINELVDTVHGVDLERLTYRLALAEPVTVPEPAADGAAAVRFLTPPAGRVVSVEGVDEARAAEGVVRVEVKAEPGRDVRPLHWSEDRSGVVVVRAENSAAAARRARQVAESIEIRTKPSERESPTTMGELLAAAAEVLDPFASEPSAPDSLAQAQFTQQEGPHACAPQSSTPPTTSGWRRYRTR